MYQRRRGDTGNQDALGDRSPAPTASTPQATGTATPGAASTPTLGVGGTPAPTPTPQRTLPELPERLSGGIEPLSPDTRTGIAELDLVIDALVTGDDATLISLIEWQQIRCSNDRTRLPVPPGCPSGTAEGTPVQALPWSSRGEANHATPESALFVIRLTQPLGEERVLCRIVEATLKDSAVEYVVELRSAVLDENHGTYFVGKFGVSVREGRITSVTTWGEPGFPPEEASCRWPP